MMMGFRTAPFRRWGLISVKVRAGDKWQFCGMDAINRDAARQYRQKAAQFRAEADRICDPGVAERLLRLAQRWENPAIAIESER
jgi:hypothetical protein